MGSTRSLKVTGKNICAGEALYSSVMHSQLAIGLAWMDVAEDWRLHVNLPSTE
jgi:hypothetical protein